MIRPGFTWMPCNVPPGAEFYFGTDSLGRDLYSIMFYGGRTSLTIGLLGAAIIAVIGTVYGCVSGVLPDRADAVMMRLLEAGGSIPSILLVLILSALFPSRNVFTLSFVIGVTGWFGMARIVRSEVRQIRNSEYVLYARCTGGSFLYVMWRHLIPNVLSAVMFAVVSNISTCITMESTLSFLGLGLAGGCAVLGQHAVSGQPGADHEYLVGHRDPRPVSGGDASVHDQYRQLSAEGDEPQTQ